MRKPVFAICEQQRRRSACTSMQSDQHLYYLLHRWKKTSSTYIQNFKSLASLCGRAGEFESYLVGNPEDRFSHDVAHIRKGVLDAKFGTNTEQCYIQSRVVINE